MIETEEPAEPEVIDLESADDWGILEELPLSDQEQSSREEIKKPVKIFRANLFGTSPYKKREDISEISKGVTFLDLYEVGKIEYIEVSANFPVKENVIITETNGLVQISERALQTPAAAKEGPFKQLVEEVIRKPGREGTKLEEVTETGTIGVEHLFGGIEVTLDDLFSEGETGTSPLIPGQEEGSVEAGSVFSKDGFLNLEQYLLRYKQDETGIHKGLVHLSSIFTSPFCIVLRKDEKGSFYPWYAVGVSQSVLDTFRLADGPHFGRALRGQGKLMRVCIPIQKIQELSLLDRVGTILQDFTPLFIPIRYREEKGLILLGVRSTFLLKDMLELLQRIIETDYGSDSLKIR